jgi:hypothetical protein
MSMPSQADYQKMRLRRRSVIPAGCETSRPRQIQRTLFAFPIGKIRPPSALARRDCDKDRRACFLSWAAAGWERLCAGSPGALGIQNIQHWMLRNVYNALLSKIAFRLPPNARASLVRAAIPQNAGLGKSATRFKGEVLVSYLNRRGISRAPNDHAYEQCVAIIAF